jgi:hypothetical protein
VPLDLVDSVLVAMSLAAEGGVTFSMVESPAIGTLSRGSKRACSGSSVSTMSVEAVLPNRLIFFARATRDDRRRSSTEGGLRFGSSS